MRILTTLKRYPATIISLILLISGISAIFIEGKVYAEYYNPKPYCNCLWFKCDPYTSHDISCEVTIGSSDPFECECPGPKEISTYKYSSRQDCVKTLGELNIYQVGCCCSSRDCIPPCTFNTICGDLETWNLADDDCPDSTRGDCKKCKYIKCIETCCGC